MNHLGKLILCASLYALLSVAESPAQSVVLVVNGGDHKGDGETRGREGREANHPPEEGEEPSRQYGLDETLDISHNGARLILRYDRERNAFTGSVRNTASRPITVQIEVHMSNDVELGPTNSAVLRPGQTAQVRMTSTNSGFETWNAHPEVQGGESGHSEGREGEHGEGREGGERGEHNEGRERGEHNEGRERGEHNEGRSERPEGHAEAGEESGADLKPDQTYDRVRGGIRLIMSYDSDKDAFVGTVENVVSRPLRRVRVEVHLSNGTELGPKQLGDLLPGGKRSVTLPAGRMEFSGWSVHAESGSGEHGGS